MRVIVRRQRPHHGAQLRLDDVDSYRLTAFATNTTLSILQDLELRHRRPACCEDRIRIAKDTDLTKLPPPRVRPEPDLVPDRSLRAAGLERDAGAGRS